jgi:apolipoprotein N-acyltransferase
VFGRASREADPDSVSYFVVLAQDGWWGNTAGYEQHFAITRLRAIETGRAVVQVTVTGTTGTILPNGTSVDETEWMDRTVRAYEVPVYRGTTPYTRFGDLPVLLFGLLLFLSGCGFHLRVQ